jgi:ATP-dependent protease ClpP protease subunit
MDKLVEGLLAQVPLDYQPAALVAAGLTALLLLLLVMHWIVGGNRSRSKNTSAKRLDRDHKIQSETYRQASREAAAKVSSLEQKTGTVVIEMIHDTDFDEYRPDAARPHISFDEAFKVIRRIESAKKGDITLILHTLGGYSMPSIMIADAIRQHRKDKGKVTAFVPRVAMSGGTIVALACDCVWMGKTARLGPIDTMYGRLSGQSLRVLKDHKSTELQDDETILHSLEAKKYDDFYQAELQRLVDAKNLDAKIYDGSLSHSNLFNRDDAESYGIRVLPRESKLGDKSAKIDARTKELQERLSDLGELAKQLVDLRLAMIANYRDRDIEQSHGEISESTAQKLVA